MSGQSEKESNDSECSAHPHSVCVMDRDSVRHMQTIDWWMGRGMCLSATGLEDKKEDVFPLARAEIEFISYSFNISAGKRLFVGRICNKLLIDIVTM
ncbi:hypothetical protein CEXT_407101 [Caerostris extrusa]|uniref:Uncharacterized protein n=1 Tax=Caerostris extrusa TaxID=172846 RepID=A0AAV4XH99_CAEEX|nr:hypothetical protein CEXT_407101 [Caerostris extrusa]